MAFWDYSESQTLYGGIDMSTGSLLVISGFSGAGKGTVIKKLLEEYDDYALSISATTRHPREGEVDGSSYFFMDREKFETMIGNDEFLEHAEYVGNYYGTPKKYVVDKLEAGINVILEIETVGALNVKKTYPAAKLIFILPPSAAELENRLKGRGTEDDATIAKRLSKAYKECDAVEAYEYIVINDSVEATAKTINMIAAEDSQTVEKTRKENNLDLIKDIKKGLEVYYKGE